MIGRLQGILLEKQPPELLLDVAGVGYEVLAPMSTFYRLPETGQTVTLRIHHQVREDAQQLYGFVEEQERALFRTLIKVSGVGPKLALAILSGIEVNDFVRSVFDQDTATLVRLPGIGKKTAERLVVELKDRLKDWSLLESTSSAGVVASEQSAGMALDHSQDAESALVALGYKVTEAAKAVAAAQRQLDGDGAEISSEALIRQALKGMVKG